MKKFMSLLLIMLISFSTVAFAKPGDIAGNVYSTDIVAYIDGAAIPSYNIGGKTVIVAEELDAYGFDVIWNERSREIKVYTGEMPESMPSYTPAKSKISGEITGTIYETDITAYVNDMIVESYNIGGRTALVMEDMASTDDNAKRISRDGNPHRAIGYSVSLMKAVWNADARTIALYTVRPKSKISTPYGEVNIESVSQADYRNGAYSLSSSDGEIVAHWISALTYKNETYLSLSEIKDNKVLGEFSAVSYDGELKITDAGAVVNNVVCKNASTSGSCVNMLITLSDKLNINGNVSSSENTDMILYKGDIYVSVSAINSALSETFVSLR